MRQIAKTINAQYGSWKALLFIIIIFFFFFHCGYCHTIWSKVQGCKDFSRLATLFFKAADTFSHKNILLLDIEKTEKKLN